MLLGRDQQYRVVGHFGDGTFGRALKCVDTVTNSIFAVKMIRSVQRYTESAKVEAFILRELKAKGGCNHNIVNLESQFTHESKNGKQQNLCLVMEPLGKSLFDFIKAN